jgi:hypothetical protein
MSSGVAFGSTTGPAAPGTVNVSVGFQPAALIIWLTHRTAVTTGVDEGFSHAYGFSDGTNHYCAGWANADVAGATFRNFAVATKVIHMRDPSGTLIAEATVSFSATGFTLDWTTVAAQYIAQYVCLGGDNVSAKVGTITSPGSVTTVESASLGFAPKGVVFASAHQGTLPLDATGGTCSFGAASATGSTEIVSTSWGKINSGASDPAQSLMRNVNYGSQDSVLNNDEIFTLSALGSDTFTASFSSSANSNLTYGFLAIGGSSGNIYVTHDSSRTSTGTTPHTGAGFAPTGALIFSGSADAAFGTDETDGAAFVIGGSDDDSNEGYMASQSKAGSPSDVGVVVSNAVGESVGLVATAAVGAPAVLDEAAIQSFDADGLTLNWTTADATARQLGIIMFLGGTEIGGFGSGIINSDKVA